MREARDGDKKGLNAFRAHIKVHYMTTIDFPSTIMDIMGLIYSSIAIKPLATGQRTHKHTHTHTSI